MFRLPSGLYFSACLGSLFLSILCTCCRHFFWYCISLIIPHNFFLRTLKTKYAKQQLVQKYFACDPSIPTCKKETQHLGTGLDLREYCKAKRKKKKKKGGVKVKVKVFLCKAWGHVDIGRWYPLTLKSILDGDNLMLLSPCARRNSYRHPLNSGLVGPRAGLDVFKKRKSLVPAGNRTTTARFYSLEHDYYTDCVIPILKWMSLKIWIHKKLSDWDMLVLLRQ